MKEKSKTCIRCGYDPKFEKSIGCYVYGDKISNRHFYTFDGDKIIKKLNDIEHEAKKK